MILGSTQQQEDKEKEVITCPKTSFIAFVMKDLNTTLPVYIWQMKLRTSCHSHGLLQCTDKAIKFLCEERN